jgi:hypothetical protein
VYGPPQISRFVAQIGMFLRLFRPTIVPTTRRATTIFTIARMSADSPAKRLKTTPRRIGTHNGHFHVIFSWPTYHTLT